jgi:hypothetical protein
MHTTNYVTLVDTNGVTGKEMTPAYSVLLTLTPVKHKKHYEELESYSTGPFIRF